MIQTRKQTLSSETFRLILLALLFSWVASCGNATESPKGTLVVVGGGSNPPGLLRKLLDFGGGTSAKVLVIPFASTATNAGAAALQDFRKAGAKDVSVLERNSRDAAAAVRAAKVIWFPGGDQSKLMQGLRHLGVVELIRTRFAQGAVVAGSSAGAAVMSRVMITGNPAEDDAEAVPPLGEGLGLWPEVIVDQHFIKRSRQPRLLAAVHTQPELLGVGIDEATAVVVRGRDVEVLGKSSVTVVDGRQAPDKAIRLLKAGDHFTVAPLPTPASNPK